MVSCMLTAGLKTGYNCGNLLKLMDDCQVLKPHFFPSVPRLFNRMYAGIQQKFGELTGCKKYLVDSAVESKKHHLHAS